MGLLEVPRSRGGATKLWKYSEETPNEPQKSLQMKEIFSIIKWNGYPEITFRAFLWPKSASQSLIRLNQRASYQLRDPPFTCKACDLRFATSVQRTALSILPTEQKERHQVDPGYLSSLLAPGSIENHNRRSGLCTQPASLDIQKSGVCSCLCSQKIPDAPLSKHRIKSRLTSAADKYVAVTWHLEPEALRTSMTNFRSNSEHHDSDISRRLIRRSMSA